MKRKKSLMIMLVFLTVVGVRLGHSYAAVSKEHDPIPWEEDIEILYEGNSKEAGNVKTESYDFYRITVKFPNASGKIREVPKSLVIYETDMGTGIKKAVHTADFGEDAGKTLVSINQPFLGKSDSFHYRAFTVEKNPLGSYRYDAMLIWSEKGDRPEAKRNAGKNVTVTVGKGISTDAATIGTKDMFGRQTHNPGFTLETPYFPQAYGNYKQWENKPYGYKDAAENGEANNTMDIRRVDDQITMNSNPDDSKNIKDSNKEMFISNAAFETHVLYTGTRLGSGDTIKFYVESNKIFDDSKDVPRKVEIPQISDYLTKLARQSQQLSDYAERPTQLIQNLDKYNIAIENAKVYPKKHMKVYLGMGSGAQGSWIIGDNKNDVSYIFADSQGRLNPQFNMYVEKNGVKTHDFVFDYINITYNPFLLGAAQVGEGDAFVKPSGFLMLNSKFKVPGDTPKPEMTLNVDGVLKANGDLKQIIDFDETLNVEGKGIQLYIAKKGTPFGVADKCTLAWDTSSGVTERILKVTIPEHHLAEIEDPDDPPTKIKHLKTGDYKIKLTIPTSLGTAYTTVAYENLVNAKNKYPIYLKVIMDDPMFIGRPDLQTRVDIKYDITPYRMPGIN